MGRFYLLLRKQYPNNNTHNDSDRDYIKKKSFN
jgi:hypothetical protein